MNFYTYAHYRESDGKCFYIGKGKGKRAFSKSSRNKHWQNVVVKHGIRVDILAHWSTESEAFEHEKFLITCFRDMGHPLTNLTDGGDGASGLSPSAETREKLAASLRGKKKSPEAVAKTAAANRGKTHSLESREKIGAAHRGKKVSPETCEKIAASKRGKKRSPEAIEKTAAANRGKKRVNKLSEESRSPYKKSPEVIEKIRIKLRGTKKSPETCANMSAERRERSATSKFLSIPYYKVDAGDKMFYRYCMGLG